MFLVTETATLADAVQQAARIAPNKGAAFDKAAGILFDVVEDQKLRLRSTDLETTFERTIPLVEAPVLAPEPFRLPSAVLSAFLMQLPLGDGHVAELGLSDPSTVEVKSGKTKAQFRTLDPSSFPDFSVEVDVDRLLLVPDFAKRVKQVAWCVARDTAPLTGIHLDGKGMIACDRSRAARVPCDIALDHAITAPLSSLSGVLSASDEVRLGGVGDRLIIVPDPDTVATSTIYPDVYPDVERLWKQTLECDQEVEFDAKEMLSVLSRILTLCRNERYPVMTLTFCDEAMALNMDVEDLGMVDDEVPCTTNFAEPFEMRFTPTNFVEALGVIGGTATLRFQRNALRPIRLFDDDQFSTVMMPRRK